MSNVEQPNQFYLKYVRPIIPAAVILSALVTICILCYLVFFYFPKRYWKESQDILQSEVSIRFIGQTNNTPLQIQNIKLFERKDGQEVPISNRAVKRWLSTDGRNLDLMLEYSKPVQIAAGKSSFAQVAFQLEHENSRITKVSITGVDADKIQVKVRHGDTTVYKLSKVTGQTAEYVR